MKIVQLSDLHVGGLFKEEAFEIIVKKVNGLSPDVIIISGDLTDDGLIFQFQQARSLIHRLNCPNLIALPGERLLSHRVFTFQKILSFF
jgi:Icc protein